MTNSALPRTLPFFVLFSATCLVACSGGGGGGGSGGGNRIVPPPPPPAPVSDCTTAPSNGGAFVQTTEQSGLCYETTDTYPPSATHVMGGGLAMSDVDQDGILDLWVTHGRAEKGRLFLGTGTGFSPAPGNNGIDLKGLDNAGYFVDIDSDGWDDFISIQFQTNAIEVFKNDQTGQFEEATASTGIYIRKLTYSMAAGDYDLDGDIDLFFAHWSGAHSETEPNPVTEYLWENDGSGFFTDVSDKVEILPSFRQPPLEDVIAEHSFTPIFADVNSDRYPDILLAADFSSSQVLINNAGVSFSDETTADITDENGMGATVADFDNDGDLDWFVSSIWFTGPPEEMGYHGGVTGNRLYRNDGTGSFTEISVAAGVRDGGWGWGSCFADFDNDGNVDIFHTNGMRSSDSEDDDTTDLLYVFFRDPSRLFMSNGNGTFTEDARALGINHSDQGRGILCTDFNNDGRVDILVATNGKSPTIYENNVVNNNHYLQVDLEGPVGNREGIGARVTVETAAGTQMQEVTLGSNYLSQQPCLLHFGLGAETEVLSVTVTWPGLAATTSRVENLSADQRLTIAAP